MTSANGRFSQVSAAPAGLNELGERAIDVVRRQFAGMNGCDDDLALFLVLDTAEGWTFCQLPSPEARSEQEFLLQTLVPQLIVRQGARALAFGFPAWSSPSADVRPTDDPGREERVVVYLLASGGQEATLMAPVSRSPDRGPELGSINTVAGSPSGAIPAALRRALQAVQLGLPELNDDLPLL